MHDTRGLVARVRELQKICWDIDWQSEEYRREIANWERIYFTRKLSIWITYALRNTAVTPNQVTALWVLLGIVGAALLAAGDRRLSLAALLVLFVSWVLDNVDGELARYKRQFSVTGNLLDMIGHEIFFSLIFGCLTLSLWRKDADGFLIVAGLLATALVTPLTKMQENVKLLLCLKALSRGERLGAARRPREEQSHHGGYSAPRTSRWLGAAGILFTQTAMFYLLIAAVVFGREDLYVALYGIGIPLAFFPKVLTRARDLEQLATNPGALENLIRPEWRDGN